MTRAFLIAVGVVLGVAASGFAYNMSGASAPIVACVHHSGGGLYIASRCDRHDRRLVLSAEAPHSTAPAGELLFAQVRGDGDLNASSPGVRASKFAGHTGAYRIDFGRVISHCAANVTLGALPYFYSPGASTPRGVGFAVVDMFSPGFTLSNGYPSGDTAQVETRANDARINAPFYIVVSC